MPPDGFECTVKLRSTSPSVAVLVTPMQDGRAQVHLKEPFAGVAPGQACVFYDGERLLGGGWIEKA
ncbi:MAG: hypothetical protein JKY27_12965 [Magnetovibrio sp.]|nr:hypothetical protein [Magnetovibrio sp.]